MREKIIYDDNLSVKTQLLNISSYPIHTHDDFQIIYVLEGELRLTLFYANYVLTPGSIHIIHPDDTHSMESLTDRNLVLILSFNTEYFQHIFSHFKTTVFITTIEDSTSSKRDVLRDQIFSIVSEDYYQGTGYASRINNAAVALFNNLMTNFRGFVIEENDKSFSHKTSNDYIQTDRISRLVQSIYENYQYKLSLAELADREQMSSYYLSHLFHKFVGVNFRDFLSMVRVEMSLESLLASNKSISQISEEMGFSDAKYYVSTFHSYLGCHPKEYRRRYGERIYGIAATDVREMPLSALKPVISNFTQYPVFKDSNMIESAIEIDFAASPGGIPTSVFSDMPMLDTLYHSLLPIYQAYSPVNLAIIYNDVNPQESVVKTLQDFAADPAAYRIPVFTLADSTTNNTGLFTPNGLKKPVYYFLEILRKLPATVISSGRSHIIFSDSSSMLGDKYVLLFNPQTNKNAIIGIMAHNLNEKYKLIKTFMHAGSSCLTYMSQLNFLEHLDESEIEIINAMTRPRVDFEILPKTDSHYTSIELEPFDVLVLHFKRVE